MWTSSAGVRGASPGAGAASRLVSGTTAGAGRGARSPCPRRRRRRGPRGRAPGGPVVGAPPPGGGGVRMTGGEARTYRLEASNDCTRGGLGREVGDELGHALGLILGHEGVRVLDQGEPRAREGGSEPLR